MPHACSAPPFRAVLFGLSGCLVDFGARMLPRALLECTGKAPSSAAPPAEALHQCLGRNAADEERQAFERTLTELAARYGDPTPGALDALAQLQRSRTPWTWLDELPEPASAALSSRLPDTVRCERPALRPWPTPDACLHALIGLGVDSLEGCLLVSGDPRLLRSGLNAGLWTVGLAASGPLCGLSPVAWHAMDTPERDRVRAQATLALYRCGAHSVIDHLAELGPCLTDLANRRARGEKP
ncbi:HAD family phosphatase [Pseudomonas sp. RIT-PI-AD]|uniref:HAD family phosphatase n=1 Tax=Pseudomonas sp. RIT-PI-AD TaxID=3035294 RepID=UPI0021D9F01C|nr:HAD family phosphatase [Pseudomonas sp. RIT-PI-AD]